MTGFEVLEQLRDTAPVERSARGRLHWQGTDAGRRRATSHTGAQRRSQGCGIARAAARRNRTVPASRVADLPKEKQQMLDRLHRSDDALAGRKVLVVDDDVRNIFALSSVLERRGMTVLSAGTGREAIETIESTTDLAIV
jgi:hypothetical protein